MRSLLAVIGLFTATVATAAPMALSTDGRLLDASGSAFNGERLVVFGLYPDDDIDSDASWSQAGEVTFEDGRKGSVKADLMIIDVPTSATAVPQAAE